MPRAPQQVSPHASPPLLITESAEEFASLREQLEQEIKPKGIVEQIYLDDLAAIVWEIQRLRRCKTAIINNALRAALKRLLGQALFDVVDPEDLGDDGTEQVEDFADRWFTNKQIRKEVLKILGRYHLDESAIEAEAIRLTASDLEVIDRMLTFLRARLDRTLRCVADYRDGLAKRLRQSSDRILEDSDVLRIEHLPVKKSA
jgi:hypothetical protein